MNAKINDKENLLSSGPVSSGPEQEFPDKVYVFIEIPKGSNTKYELDKKTGLIFVDRELYTAMHYPGDYGFVPQTLCEDGDPVDVIVLTNHHHLPGTVILSRPVALIKMRDEKGDDEKVICVPDKKIDPFFENVNDLEDIPQSLLDKIKHFFEQYKALEPGKWTKVEEWYPKEKAKEYILEAKKRYRGKE